MTEQEFDKIGFRMVSHLSAAREHVASYVSVDHIPKIEVCVHTPVKRNGEYGKPEFSYRFLGEIYDDKAMLLEAMTAHEQSLKDKFKRQ